MKLIILLVVLFIGCGKQAAPPAAVPTTPYGWPVIANPLPVTPPDLNFSGLNRPAEIEEPDGDAEEPVEDRRAARVYRGRDGGYYFIEDDGALWKHVGKDSSGREVWRSCRGSSCQTRKSEVKK